MVSVNPVMVEIPAHELAAILENAYAYGEGMLDSVDPAGQIIERWEKWHQSYLRHLRELTNARTGNHTPG